MSQKRIPESKKRYINKKSITWRYTKTDSGQTSMESVLGHNEKDGICGKYQKEILRLACSIKDVYFHHFDVSAWGYWEK